MTANACASSRPWPKNSGAEPMPPKFPQPSAIRGAVTSERPTLRASIPTGVVIRDPSGRGQTGAAPLIFDQKLPGRARWWRSGKTD